jgi:hypothetical protein
MVARNVNGLQRKAQRKDPRNPANNTVAPNAVQWPEANVDAVPRKDQRKDQRKGPRKDPRRAQRSIKII